MSGGRRPTKKDRQRQLDSQKPGAGKIKRVEESPAAVAGKIERLEEQLEQKAQEEKKVKRRMIRESLESAVEALDWDGVVYELTQIAVAKRNAEDELEEPNPAQQKYLQSLVEFFTDAQERIEAL